MSQDYPLLGLYLVEIFVKANKEINYSIICNWITKQKEEGNKYTTREKYGQGRQMC